jgi:hypothetical protein
VLGDGGSEKNGDAFVRVLLTPDGTRVLVNDGPGDAGVWIIDTSDDALTEGIQATLAGDGNEDAALRLFVAARYRFVLVQGTWLSGLAGARIVWCWDQSSLALKSAGR